LKNQLMTLVIANSYSRHHASEWRTYNLPAKLRTYLAYFRLAVPADLCNGQFAVKKCIFSSSSSIGSKLFFRKGSNSRVPM